MRVMSILTGAIVLGALVGLGLFLGVRPSPESATAASRLAAGGQDGPRAEPAPAPRVGAPAPDIRLTALDGTPVALSALRGRVVLVNFWASWCGPCEQEMADLQRLYDEERGRGLVILGVNEGEEPGRVAGFLSRYGITFPTVTDTDRSVTRRYQVYGLPNSFLVDGDGIVRARIVGPFSLQQMRHHLEATRQGRDVSPPDVRSVAAATIGQADQSIAEVGGAAITRGDVHRRIDLEQAFAAVRGGTPPDLTASENQLRLRQLQRIVAERLIEERLIVGRAAAAGLLVPEGDIDSEVNRVADEVQLTPERLATELAARGGSIDELRAVHRAAITIGQFVAERVLTGQTEEKIDDYEAWLSAAKQTANARVLLPE
ncbi:MAG: redoxin domain-containing protein [Chloroflexota bacterium]